MRGEQNGQINSQCYYTNSFALEVSLAGFRDPLAFPQPHFETPKVPKYIIDIVCVLFQKI